MGDVVPLHLHRKRKVTATLDRPCGHDAVGVNMATIQPGQFDNAGCYIGNDCPECLELVGKGGIR